MNVGNKVLNVNWEKVDEVSDGSTYYIQALTDSVRFIVSASAPSNDDDGGLIPNGSQLAFSKVGGDLYLRSRNSLIKQIVHIEESEA